MIGKKTMITKAHYHNVVKAGNKQTNEKTLYANPHFYEIIFPLRILSLAFSKDSY